MPSFYSESYLSWIEAERKAKDAQARLRLLGREGPLNPSEFSAVKVLYVEADDQFQAMMKDIEARSQDARHSSSSRAFRNTRH